MTGQDVIKRYDAMGDYARGNWENLWQECADWCWPSNDNINEVHTPGAEKPPQRMIDSCIEANYNFAAGYSAHMFTPNMWILLAHVYPQHAMGQVSQPQPGYNGQARRGPVV